VPRRRGLAIAFVVAVLAATMIVAGLAVAAPGASASRRPTAEQIKRCESLRLFGPARAVPGAVPAMALAPYAVFRRPQAPSDLPSVQMLGSLSLAAMLEELQAYDPADTRLVATIGKTSVYLLAGTARDLTLPARCRRVLPAYALTFVDSIVRRVGHGPAYCLLAVDWSPTGGNIGSACFALAFGARNVFTADAGLGNLTVSADGLVPDGVGAVLVSYPTGARDTVGVQNNVALAAAHRASPKLTRRLERELRAALHSPRRLRRFINRTLPTSIDWLAAPGGAVVRSFSRPAGLLKQAVAEFLADWKIVSSATSGSSSSPAVVCTTSSGPGKPTRKRCSTAKHR
jgi:hypothetical protein